MATTILPKKYTSQAREHVYVDFSNPLAYGLVSAYGLTSYEMPVRPDGSSGKLSGRKSSATPNPYTLHGYANDGTTEARLVYSAEGAVWDFGGTYATKAYNTLHPKNWTGAATYIIRVLLRNTSASQCLIGGFHGGLVPVYKYGCGILISGDMLYGVGAYNNSKVISAPAPAAGEWVTLACVSNTSNGKLAINGRVVATGDLSGAWSGYVFAVGCGGNDSGGSSGSGAAILDGLVGPALVFNRALSDAEIAALSDNPYQILRAKRSYLAEAIAGLSSVSNDIVLNYNLSSTAQSDGVITWNILNSVSKDGSVLWNLQNSVTSDRDISWGLVSQVIGDKGLSWGILSTAVKDGTISWDTRSSVTTNANISWNILSSAFVDKPIRYDILTNVGSNQSTSWNISQFVYADKTVNWDIQSTMLTAFADIALRYDIVTKVYQDFNIYWGLLQQASSDKALNFNVLSSILSDKAIAWGIAEAVVNDLTVTANLLQNTGQELTLTWESAGIVSGDLVIKYNISSDTITLPAIKRMITVSAQDTKLKVLKDSRIISI